MAGRRIPTPSQTLGPFFGFALPFAGDADAVAPGANGAWRIEGQVLDGEGKPVSDCLIELWNHEQFARSRTDSEGAFHFNFQKPPSVRLKDGRVRAPHMNVTVFARGLLRQLATFVYFPDEKDNRADPVLELLDPVVRDTLIARRDGQMLRFDIHLQGEGETAFFAL